MNVVNLIEFVDKLWITYLEVLYMVFSFVFMKFNMDWNSIDWEKGCFEEWWNYPTMHQVWSKGMVEDKPMIDDFDDELAERILSRTHSVYASLDEGRKESLYQAAKVMLDELVGERVWVNNYSRVFPVKIIETNEFMVNVEFEGDVFTLTKAITFPMDTRFDFMLKFI